MAGLREFQAKSKPTVYFTLAKDQTISVLFLREPGDALFVVEHHSPSNWKKRIVCTADEGDCYGCERASQEAFSGWAQKPKMYIDVLVGFTDMEALLVQTMTVSSLTPALLMYYNENGTIRNTWFNVTKSGTGKKTKYTIAPTDGDLVDRKPTMNLQKNVTKIHYEAQPNYLTN